MENKETIKISIADATALNDLFNNSKFGDISIETISNVLELKFELSKIVQDKNEFVKQSIESIKTDEYKQLSDKENKTEEETEEFKKQTEEFNKKLTDILNHYLVKEIEISLTKINKEEFYKFCKANDFTVAVIEYLYNKIVK